MNDIFIIPLFNIFIFSLAALLTYLLTLFFIKVAFYFDLLDYPKGRKNHLKPVPYLGGAAIFISFWLVVFLGIFASSFFSMDAGGHKPIQEVLFGVNSLFKKVLAIFAGSAVILLVGLLDDKYHWSPLKKLFGQIIAALILISSGLMINFVSSLGPLGYVITFIWILLIINAFNLTDYLDGHCTGIALISTIMFFWMTQIIDQVMVGLFLAVFAGSLLGFFPHNFKPARIFLGDNGSLLIGYMMASFTLLCRYQTPDNNHATAFIPVLIFGVPIYDTLSVIVVRISRGIAPWHGDRNHFAHRLVQMGMSEKAAVVFSYFVAITLGHIAILTTQVNFFGEILIGIIFISIMGLIAFLEYYAVRFANLAGRSQRS